MTKIKIRSDIDCPSCAAGITKTLGKEVDKLEINVGLKLVKVEFDENKISAEEIVKKINDLGYKSTLA